MLAINHTNHKQLKILILTNSVLVAIFGINTSYADMVQSLTGFDINNAKLLKDNGIVVGGWANAGITYNANNPEDNFNGPVGFNDRSNEFQLNQLNLFLQRAVTTEGNSWDFGTRIDVMYGTDAIFAQAFGVPPYDINTGQPLKTGTWDLNMIGSETNRFYDIAIPQAFLEIYAPFGNGLNIKVGHFYTILGYEPMQAPDSFFYSHSYTALDGEPGTHTGLLVNYAFNKNWSVTAGPVTGSATGGWDGAWDQQLGNWAGMGGLTWTSNSANSTLNISGTYGKTSEHINAAWGMYSIVLQQDLTDSAHLIVQHDHGYANNTASYDNAGNIIPNNVDAQWYGINTHLYYDIKENLTVGIRGEWFRDHNGFRVLTPVRVFASTYDSNGIPRTYAGNNILPATPSGYYDITLGMNWKPKVWLNIRPNIRYDWVDGGGNYKPFDTGNKKDQFLFSTDITVVF